MNDLSTVKGRIKHFSENQGLTIKDFEKSIGASNGYINSIRSSIGAEFFWEIIRTYSNVNPDWILKGEGEMLIEKSHEELSVEILKKLVDKVEGFSLINASLAQTIQDLSGRQLKLEQEISKMTHKTNKTGAAK